MKRHRKLDILAGKHSKSNEKLPINPKGLGKSAQLSNSVHCVPEHTPCAFKKKKKYQDMKSDHTCSTAWGRGAPRTTGPHFAAARLVLHWKHDALCGGKERSPPSLHPSGHTCLRKGLSQEGLEEARISPVPCSRLAMQQRSFPAESGQSAADGALQAPNRLHSTH